MKTPDEIKKGLECCADLQGYDADCLNCPYNGEQWCGDKSKADALTYIRQLERERDSALGLIGRLMVILKKYSRDATNGCAYAAHEEIKKWLLGFEKPRPEPPVENGGADDD